MARDVRPPHPARHQAALLRMRPREPIPEGISSMTAPTTASTTGATARAPETPPEPGGPPVQSSRGQRAKLLLVSADIVALAAAILGTYALQRTALRHHGGNGNHRHFLTTSLVTLPGWLAVFANQRLYNTRFIGRRIDESRRVINACFMGMLVVALVASGTGYLVPRSALVTLFAAAAVLVLLERELARRLFLRLRSHGRMLRYVVIAGANPEGRELAAMLITEPWLGYHVLGFVDDTTTDPQPVAGVPLLGTLADTGRIVRDNSGTSVIVASSGVDTEVTNRLARDLLDQGIHVELSSTLRDISSQRLTVRPLGRFPIVYVEPVVRGGWRAAAKRAFDLVGAGLGLVLASPILAVAALAIRLDSKGGTLFRQVRVGRNGTPFKVLKLRTMVADAEARLGELAALNEADGPLFKMKSDPRVTRVGRVLRKTSIDEIPQLWNVLRGEMSLVGPRPALPHETEEWDALLTQRLRVKPGMTGMWQVSGRSDTSFEDYTRLDLYYVDNWSLATDLAILAKTVPVVLLRRGAA
ncbi:MAG: putative undecaprenyl-phosphate glycosylphosphotransferase [Acidimicrobiales bacterium]|nr:putative undecaprenyl-phosphate glycosylphosphotransferase [Acidimicrobiales bacterium]